ncbi:MAG: complex I NDUFA9 subunit family protein, partial [Rickettsiales bacterium]|nr:complex I NDUFA9 subunit family protein [Rickettsiales bacterium]
EDDFFNRFANMARFLPALPLIGGGKTRFQPVYAGDVAEAVRRCLTKPATIGQTYELGGLHIYTFRELLEYILQQTSRSCCLVNIPFPLASLEASILEWFPKPLLTRDQVKLLHIDNVVSSENSLQTLGITPRGIEQIVPTYLARYRKP